MKTPEEKKIPTKEEIIELVDKFLEKRVENDGEDWTPVSNEDYELLSSIIHKLIDAKWDKSFVRASSVEFELCNRNKWHFVPFVKLPYNDNTEDPFKSRASYLSNLIEYAAKEISHSIRFHLIKSKEEGE